MDRAKRGEIHTQVVKCRHLKCPLTQPICTHSQTIEFLDADGKRIALCHQYKRRDGSIGGSGKPDPKRLIVDQITYFTGCTG